MANNPFLTLSLRGKKDTVLARQRARRVASLLNFDGNDQACIAAGAFVIACQALLLFGKAKICFRIENRQLQVYGEDVRSESDARPMQGIRRLENFFPAVDAKSLFLLTKPLPDQDLAADEVELGWLVNQVENTACNGLFDEIVRQNQEVLSLLHEVRLYQLGPTEKMEKPFNPHAA